MVSCNVNFKDPRAAEKTMWAQISDSIARQKRLNEQQVKSWSEKSLTVASSYFRVNELVQTQNPMGRNTGFWTHVFNMYELFLTMCVEYRTFSLRSQYKNELLIDQFID